MTFFAKPVTFRNDHARVTFAASYLTDHAQAHYMSLLHYGQNHPATLYWIDFTREFGNMFGVVNTRIEAEQNLRQLQMHDRDRFSTFIIRFEEHSFESGWNDTALLSELNRALAPRIKEILKTIPRATSFRQLRDLAMSIDQRHWEYEQENRRTLGRPYAQSGDSRPQVTRDSPDNRQPPRPARDPRRDAPPRDSRPDRPNQSAQRSPPAPQRPRQPAPPSPDQPTAEERERRRRDGLCYRCGEPGHFGLNCPKAGAVGRALFTIDEDDIQETFEETPVEDEEHIEEETAENEAAIQELPGEI
jgi:hypothetical protein